jgi:hypothetical protein
MKDGNVSAKDFPKQVKVVVIFPCRLVPVDQYQAKEYKYGEKVTLSKDDALEALGHKRVALEADYKADDYPEPINKKPKVKPKPEVPKVPVK